MNNKIDENLELVLKAAGSKLRHYTPCYKEELREAMRKIMSDSYIAGSNDCAKALSISK